MVCGVVVLHQFAVDPGGDHAAVGFDDDAVPLPRLVNASQRWNVAVDRHRRMLGKRRLGRLIPELQLHAVAGGPGVAQHAQAHARVAVALHLIFQREQEIAEEFFASQIVSAAGLQDQRAGVGTPRLQIAWRPPSQQLSPRTIAAPSGSQFELRRSAAAAFDRQPEPESVVCGQRHRATTASSTDTVTAPPARRIAARCISPRSGPTLPPAAADAVPSWIAPQPAPSRSVMRRSVAARRFRQVDGHQRAGVNLQRNRNSKSPNV